jgi:hypothetical protein
MPPRGAAAPAGDPFAALPHALACHVFSLLSPHERARCALVCRGWCATLKDQRLWLRLDLSRADGAECSEATLRGAVARAGGQLQSLHLAYSCTMMHGAVCAIAAANAATLRELSLVSTVAGEEFQTCEKMEELLHAAPQLHALETGVFCESLQEAQRLMRNAPPFGPLRVRQLAVSECANTAGAVIALAAEVAQHAWLVSLDLYNAALHAPAALDAVVDAALARRLSSLGLHDCFLSPASAPALVRLLGGNALTDLHIYNAASDLALLDAPPAAAQLGDALRANTSLTALSLQAIDLWGDPAVVQALLPALTAHPRLRVLDLSWNMEDGDAAIAAGTALSALLLANAPALHTLNIEVCALDNDVWEGLGQVLEALPFNTHLTKLDCSGNHRTEEFARQQLLPAVRANTGLRELVAREYDGEFEVAAAVHEAVALVAARAVLLNGASHTAAPS